MDQDLIAFEAVPEPEVMVTFQPLHTDCSGAGGRASATSLTAPVETTDAIVRPFTSFC